jgi:hypothetical protein
MSLDYLHEDTSRLEKQLDELKLLRQKAQEEAQHARSLRLDMEGPIKASEAEVQRLSVQLKHIERVIARVKAGFPYLERRGFNDAVEATFDEPGEWHQLLELPVPGVIWADEGNAAVRLPIDVQKRYAQAVSSDLFDGFEVCVCWETADNESTRRTTLQHLFGTIQSPNEEDEGKAIFLIAQW